MTHKIHSIDVYVHGFRFLVRRVPGAAHWHKETQWCKPVLRTTDSRRYVVYGPSGQFVGRFVNEREYMRWITKLALTMLIT